MTTFQSYRYCGCHKRALLERGCWRSTSYIRRGFGSVLPQVSPLRTPGSRHSNRTAKTAKAVKHERDLATRTTESTSGRVEENPPKRVHDRSSPLKNTGFPYKLIAGLAAAGAGLTGYLTLEKLTGGNVACPASGSCDTILSSGYATVFGIPLSLLGLLAYGSVATFAAWQAFKQQGAHDDLGRLGILGGGLALAATSSNLLYLLWAEFPGQTCTWCLASALLSYSIFLAACTEFKPRRELAELAAPGGLTAAGVTLFLAFAWSGVEAPQALANINIPFQPTIVRGSSSPRALDVAKRLRQAGAKMYGAFWCTHCQEQKIAFGRDAQQDLPYVECFPDGYKSGVQMVEECRAAKLEGFPLWIINGHRYEGEQTLSSLEAALKKPVS